MKAVKNLISHTLLMTSARSISGNGVLAMDSDDEELTKLRQQKAQDIMANLASKRGQRGGGTRTRVRMRT
mgnify:CR=1 FL=1